MGWLLALCGEALPALGQPIFKICRWGRGLDLIQRPPEIFFVLHIHHLMPTPILPSVLALPDTTVGLRYFYSSLK